MRSCNTVAPRLIVVAQQMGNPLCWGNAIAAGTDLNTITTQGRYILNGSYPNLPSAKDYYILEVVRTAGNIYQRLLRFNSATFETWIRGSGSASNTTSWKPWARLDNFGATTEAELASVVAGIQRQLTKNNVLKDQPAGDYIWVNADTPVGGVGLNVFCKIFVNIIRGEKWAIAFDANTQGFYVGKLRQGETDFTWKMLASF